MTANRNKERSRRQDAGLDSCNTLAGPVRNLVQQRQVLDFWRARQDLNPRPPGS